ncbi:guanylate kinase-associated protein mars-like, partial [Hylaeus anthracinus]|uniref:guanylate kinase-associated protein mars-like n=1 Tax=Hylaeus anthracinus TaxID=313031 RepID=UPI0023BA0151
MSYLYKLYKDKRPFGDVNEKRAIRAEKQKELRKNRRDKIVGENRNGLTSSTSQNLEIETPDPVEIRAKRLLQWKIEREKRKRMEQMKKRRPFVVGVVHHKLYSPGIKDQDIPKVKKPPTPPKRVTRATLKRLMLKTQQTKQASQQESNKKEKHSFAPANYEFKFPAGVKQELLFGRVDPHSMTPSVVSKFVLPSSRLTRASTNSSTTKFIKEEIASATINKKDDTNSSEESLNETFTLNVSSSNEDINDTNEAIISDKDSNEKKKEKNDESLNNNITEPNKQFNNSIKEVDTILDNNAKSALSPSNNNTPTPANSNSFSEPVFYSPYVVSSRGKSNARKEQQLKRGFSLGSMRSDDIPTKDNVMKNLNISVEEEERTAQYFQFLLNKEIDRLNELCIKWEQVKTESNITEDAQYQINQAVGQTNLLISKKFERFRGLVSDCETGKGQMLVTCRDLQGFWDMMYMEVKNCDSRFEKLEQLRSQNWIEEQATTVFKPSIAKKSTMRKKAVLGKSSAVRAFLANRKKGKQETRIEDVVEESAIINNKVSVDEHELNKNSPNVKCRPRRSVSV